MNLKVINKIVDNLKRCKIYATMVGSVASINFFVITLREEWFQSQSDLLENIFNKSIINLNQEKAPSISIQNDFNSLLIT